MAANLKGRVIAGSLGKRLANQIWASSSRRAAYSSLTSSSSYDKELDDQVRPAVVPDYVIEPKSDKYWGPHPGTGVFGPADPNSAAAAGSNRHGVRGSTAAAVTGDGGSSSVLDQTAWFRPLEDVDKPPHN